MFFLTGINPNNAHKEIKIMIDLKLFKLTHRKTERSFYPVRYFHLSIENIQAFINFADKEYKRLKDEYNKINITEIRTVFKEKCMSYQHTPVCQDDMGYIPAGDNKNNNKINTIEKKNENNNNSVSQKLKDYKLDKFIKDNVNKINPYLFGNE